MKQSMGVQPGGNVEGNEQGPPVVGGFGGGRKKVGRKRALGQARMRKRNQKH